MQLQCIAKKIDYVVNSFKMCISFTLLFATWLYNCCIGLFIEMNFIL